MRPFEQNQKAESRGNPVVVVGAGLAGLSCAGRIHAAGTPVLVLEADDGVGGRVRTDKVNGFLLDRGFQVFLDAYPEAAGMLDYERLKLRSFYPGALIQIDGRRYRFADPWRRPLASLAGLLAPVAGLHDAMRIARLRSAALGSIGPHDEDLSPDTLTYLRSFGLSDRVIDRFFRPFFGGVFLERDLKTPSSFFRFVFSMFARGSAALPVDGMGAISAQLSESLPKGVVRLNTPVDSIEAGCVRLTSGQVIRCRATVIATDAESARRLDSPVGPISWNSATTLYYSVERPPTNEGILILNGMNRGLVNHVCVPSNVSPRYAPTGLALISVSIIGIPDLDDEALDLRVVDELGGWFGNSVASWKLLRIYRIRCALPVLNSPASTSPRSQSSGGIFLCGDYLEGPSINGALASGRKAADAVLKHLEADGNKRAEPRLGS